MRQTSPQIATDSSPAPHLLPGAANAAEPLVVAAESDHAAHSGSPSAVLRSAAAAALLGFLVGAVFWHFVGFWGFVREVVLKGPEPEASRVAQTGAQCTALVLDRASGLVRADGCPGDAPWFVEGPGGPRADMLVPTRPVVAKRWSVTVQADPAPDED